MYEEVPYIFIASPDVLIAARRSVQNFVPAPLAQASIGLHNVEEIYLEQYRSGLNSELNRSRLSCDSIPKTVTVRDLPNAYNGRQSKFAMDTGVKSDE